MKYLDLPENKIINYYNSGISITQLSKKYNVSRYVITDRLSKNNIIQYKHGFFLRKCKEINEHYFDNIDSEEKAYFLGLLCADGCNHNLDKKKKISISLQAEDRLILEKLSKAILSNVNLNFIKRRRPTHKDQYRLSINSSILSDQLNKLGCCANKSLILEYPKIDKLFDRHFIRGYFDGDGTVGSYKRKSKNNIDYFAEIVSTNNFCNSAIKIIKDNIDINVLTRLSSPKNNLITTKLYIKGNFQIIKFLDWIYGGSTIYLDRKHDKYLQIKAHSEA